MPYNMLIVDDSATTRRMIGKTLRLAGVDIADIHEAADGRQALELLREHWVDLILTDINMPVMNGVELVETMYRDGLMQTIPVVIVSTEGSVTRIDQLKAKGVAAYLRKPFTPEEIRNVVEEILGVSHEN